jgi:3-deoxy-D-manno-octulosonate 8-phosphate phosphatase (KDO 8-P phosphatase)
MRARDRARRVKMILSDVDGTLTDGTIAVLPDGEEVKSYDVKDGLGVFLARSAGLEVGLITGKMSAGLEKRAERLRIKELHQGVADKMPVFEAILAKHGLSAVEVAYLGDDLGDLAVMKRAGLAAAVRDAHHLVRKQAHYVCARGGGRGAFRELVEFIVGAQKKWGVVEERFSSMFDRKL